MPTIQQLIRIKRKTQIQLTKSPALKNCPQINMQGLIIYKVMLLRNL